METAIDKLYHYMKVPTLQFVQAANSTSYCFLYRY
jgi:hypothetical protein